MICPACNSDGGRRSRRRSVLDHVLSSVGLFPFRCQKCEKRFRSRSVALRNVKYARCALCGNLELQKIAPEYVPGILATLARLFGLPALRCEPCRNKFFAVRPVMREQPRLSSSRDQAA